MTMRLWEILHVSGTLVTSGQSKGVVVATGSNTEVGRISGLLSEVRSPHRSSH